jgi:hypothetical protein
MREWRCGNSRGISAHLVNEHSVAINKGAIMAHNLYLGSVVLFRIFSVLALLWGTFLVLTSMPVTLQPNGGLIATWPTFIPVIGALILWSLAKPIGRLVTSGLDH